MRITNKILIKGYLSDLTRNLNNMQKLQEQLSSGKEIRRPSDDPFKVARAMELTSDIASNERYTKNIDEGIGWLQTVESSLGQMTEAMQTIREKAVAGGNGSYGEDEKNAIMNYLVELKGHLVDIGNTSFDGRYIFGGDNTTDTPFVNIDGNVVYKGSDRGLIREFAQGVKMDIGYTGDNFTSLFGNTEITEGGISLGKNTTIKKTGTPINEDKIYEVKVAETDKTGKVTKISIKIGETETDFDITYPLTETVNVASNSVNLNGDGDNLFVEINGITLNIGKDLSNKKGDVYSFNSETTVNVLDKMIYELKNGGDSSKYLGEIDSKFNEVLRIRSEAGARWQRLNDMKAKTEEEHFNMTELLSKTSDIDLAKKVMECKIMENVYTASLQTGAKILQPSLLDFIR